MVEIDIISGVYSTIIGALVGAVSAFMLTRHLMTQKQKNELKKIQNIINDEFYRIYYYANESIKIITELVENGTKFDEHILDIRHEISRGRTPLLIDLPNLRFLLWNSIVSSGRMIELETNEIQLINTAHDNAEEHFTSMSYEMKQFDQKMRYTQENPVQYSIKEIKMYTHMFYTKLYAELHLVKHQFDILNKKIDWIRDEFSTDMSKKINEEFTDYPQGIFTCLPFSNDEFERKTAI